MKAARCIAFSVTVLILAACLAHVPFPFPRRQTGFGTSKLRRNSLPHVIFIRSYNEPYSGNTPNYLIINFVLKIQTSPIVGTYPSNVCGIHIVHKNILRHSYFKEFSLLFVLSELY